MTLPIAPKLDLFDLLQDLLRFCAEHDDILEWTRLSETWADFVDDLRREFDAHAPKLISPSVGGQPAAERLASIITSLDTAPPLVVAAACARAIDDVYAPMLVNSWAGSRSPQLSPGDLVVLPDDAHLAALFPGHSLAARSTRLTERADHTTHARLFDPHPSCPSLVLDRRLDLHIQEVMWGASGVVTCHPNASRDDFGQSLPLRPVRPAEHEAACEDLLRRAFAVNAAVVAFPEFAGYDAVTDRLRRVDPTRPTLVVAGSGHTATGGRRANRSLAWIARPTGTVAGTIATTYKRLPYEGSLGHESLTELGDEVRVYVGEPWRIAFGICRDLLDPVVSDALVQVGVNLLVVPACSAKTTNLAASTGLVASSSPGIAIVANGPRYFPGRGDGEVVDVPSLIYSAPIDRTEPRIVFHAEPPGAVLVEFAVHSAFAI